MTNSTVRLGPSPSPSPLAFSSPSPSSLASSSPSPTQKEQSSTVRLGPSPSPKKLLLLGGIRYLLPVIKAAHDLGIRVLTADYLPDNIAHRYSDEYVNERIAA